MAEKKDKVQVGARIDAELWRKFKAKCILEDKNNGKVLESLIKNYLEENRKGEK